jgi:hypothetical protein
MDPQVRPASLSKATREEQMEGCFLTVGRTKDTAVVVAL